MPVRLLRCHVGCQYTRCTQVLRLTFFAVQPTHFPSTVFREIGVCGCTFRYLSFWPEGDVARTGAEGCAGVSGIALFSWRLSHRDVSMAARERIARRRDDA